MDACHAKLPYDCFILVLQGGGALGAYQAGVFEGLTEAGCSPDWVTGVSIGAINGALIAGNPPKQRVARLRGFWDRVSSGASMTAHPIFRALHWGFARAGASLGSVVGVPGLFSPRVPPPAFMPEGTPSALSVYDIDPLRTTLGSLVDFDLIRRRDVRLSVGAVNIRTGDATYFDSLQTQMNAEHVLASAALPPAFAPIEIDGEYYWDGGIVSNTPLSYAVDHSAAVNVLIVQVDLFRPEGELPRNLDQVMERHKDIMYSSRKPFESVRVRKTQRQRGALRRLLQKLPARFKSDPDVKILEAEGRPGRIDIVRLINRRLSYMGSTKDYEFSRAAVNELWAAGLDDARSVLAHPECLVRTDLSENVRAYDLTRGPRKALRSLFHHWREKLPLGVRARRYTRKGFA
jgi:NTE family protein